VCREPIEECAPTERGHAGGTMQPTGKVRERERERERESAPAHARERWRERERGGMGGGEERVPFCESKSIYDERQ
jgi:hypothetical protein